MKQRTVPSKGFGLDKRWSSPASRGGPETQAWRSADQALRADLQARAHVKWIRFKASTSHALLKP